jgi:hypothetical protein
MAIGARKGFAVLTNANEKFIYKLVAYINIMELATTQEIYLEYMTQPRRQFNPVGTTPSTSWNLMPTKEELLHFIRNCPVFTKEKYVLIRKKGQKDNLNANSTTFCLTTKWVEENIFWSLSEDWSTKLGKVFDNLRYKKILKQNQARTQTGKKWAKHEQRIDIALSPLKLRGWNKNV